MDLAPVPNPTLGDCHRGCVGMVDAEGFDANAVDGRNLVISAGIALSVILHWVHRNAVGQC